MSVVARERVERIEVSADGWDEREGGERRRVRDGAGAGVGVNEAEEE